MRSGHNSSALCEAAPQRYRIELCGVVQGVGLRPFIFRLANTLELSGWVENNPQGVMLEVEGPPARLNEFRQRLNADQPRLATYISVQASRVAPHGETRFQIRRSNRSGARSTLVLPDIATCPDCVNDVLDPKNRRYRYPFTNCTNCGPRYSIIRALPYDRANTTMRDFQMCAACQYEYEDPMDRRFHAQPNACSQCGPRIELWGADCRIIEARDGALQAAVEAVRNGKIVALKGLGGFQLLVDARQAGAVAELRRRKCREEKPFAMMFPSVAMVEQLCQLDESEHRLLTSPEAPIVLLRGKPNAEPRIAPNAAPNNPYFGIMLPCTPLHHLLLGDLGFPLVATSGNRSDEPICIDEHEAVTRLGGIADLFLVHNRPIVRGVDDSVVRIMSGRETVLRRARGYAPLPIAFSGAGPTILAVGAHQKNTVAWALRGQVFVSQHLGDLVTRQAVQAFDQTAHDLQSLFDSEPALVVCDAHPDYTSTKRAERLGKRLLRVQHHHAHVASCMLENNLDGPVLGVCWDGTGYGLDGTIWGGEFLRCDGGAFERVAHLRPFPLPGGDLVSQEPRRSAMGLLFDGMGARVFDCSDLSPVGAFEPSELRVIRSMLLGGVNSPVTSSMGRLFDGVASIIGLRQRVNTEGQAAMELEFAACGNKSSDAYPMRIQVVPNSGSGVISGVRWIVDWRLMILAILRDLQSKRPIAHIARRFHVTLADLIVKIARRVGERRVVLSGGCFQNALLTELTVAGLERNGFDPYWHHRVPPNDGGISLGQVAVARTMLKEKPPCV